MRHKKKKKAAVSGRGQKTQAVGGGIKEAATAPSEPGLIPSQYIFTFELIRHYPTTRSFIIKQPLSRSFKDTLSELFGGNKKGVYRF